MPYLIGALFLALISYSCEAPSSEQQTKSVVEQAPESDTIEATLDTIPLKYLLGQFDPARDSLFRSIDPRFSQGSATRQMIHRETHDAFERMWEAAKQDGISLKIVSATRPFNYQKSIWEGKWKGQRLVGGKNLAQTVPDPAERASLILRYSSMPGTSRHHWGTDIDLNNFENRYFEQGQGLKEYQWLQAHAAEYGFCQVYSPKGEDRPYGYEEEKWHWSYRPLADRYLASYLATVTPEMITGFAGSEVVRELAVIERYVNGISPACKP